MPENGIPSVLTGALQFGIKPGLERINRLLELLGNPQDEVKAVHVAGTTAKVPSAHIFPRYLPATARRWECSLHPILKDFPRG